MHAAKLIGWCDAKLGAKKAIDISSSKLESSYICGQNNSTLRKTTLYDRQKSANVTESPSVLVRVRVSFLFTKGLAKSRLHYDCTI